MLAVTGALTYRAARPILIAAVILGACALYGISLIRVNDNPIKWFKASHPIRVADHVLNEHFGGTYMAYLAISAETAAETDIAKFADSLATDLAAHAASLDARDYPDAARIADELARLAMDSAARHDSAETLLAELAKRG